MVFILLKYKIHCSSLNQGKLGLSNNLYFLKMKSVAPILILSTLLNGNLNGAIQVNVDTDGYLSIQNAHAGTKNTSFGIAPFFIDVLSIDGVDPGFDDNLLGFCIELEQGISNGTRDFEYPAPDLSEAAASSAGTNQSANIPFGGIGDERAARVRYLFDNYYQGTSIESWTNTNNTPDVYAFQLAVWELAHDDDLTLAYPGFGNNELGLWVGGVLGWRNSGTALAAVELAESWLESISTASVDSSYQSQQWELMLLADDHRQDLILSTGITPIPEPSVYIGLSSALFSLLYIQKRQRKASKGAAQTEITDDETTV